MRSDHMEQTRNRWIWAASNLEEKVALGHGGSQIHGSAYAAAYESWEERAFAEDSAGHLGGCVWPPRSYPCSFCKREFRSAQALGGHMNVHRRDRARLKQSLSPDGYDAATAADCGSARADPPLVHKSGGGPTACAGSAPPPDLSPRVSAAAGAGQYALFSPPCKSLPSSVSVLLELVPPCKSLPQESKLRSENSCPSDRNIDHDDDDDDEEEEEEEKQQRRQHIGSIIKRQRTEIDFSAAAIREKVQSDQVLKQSSWPVEELDLELRLGRKRKLPVMILL